LLLLLLRFFELISSIDLDLRIRGVFRRDELLGRLEIDIVEILKRVGFPGWRGLVGLFVFV
jgi:hypothetical protein